MLTSSFKGSKAWQGLNNTDLCGIRWRQLVLGERPNAAGDPLDDPVVRSYSKCLAVDILCVWRRVVAPKPKPKLEPDPSNMFDMSIPGTGNSGSVIHPPLSLTAAKELWIFWYGEEPDLTDLVAPELLNSSEMCRPLLSNQTAKLDAEWYGSSRRSLETTIYNLTLQLALLAASTTSTTRPFLFDDVFPNIFL
uniref:Mediator of RNA polymerase II transcription subunit 13 n=1 Tax=Anopheles culicifacies TaxID=139723 RepID=A0A182MDU0_9DIPT